MTPKPTPQILTNTTVRPSYRPQAPDANIDADIYLFARLRQLSLKQRVEMAASHDRGIKRLCLAGIKSRNCGVPLEEIRLHFARAVLAEKFLPGFQPTGDDETRWIQDSITLAGELHQILESVNIPYYVSGNVASSIHGELRSTRNLDLVISNLTKTFWLVKTLEAAGYYCPAGAVEDLQRGREGLLNITHTETIANADL
ncbi:MAG: hypothetical protein AAF063_34880, partial [Cyanobacteria bacterium J06643_5]